MTETDTRQRFGPWSFDPTTKGLARDGRPVALARQLADALALLVAARGDIVTRDRFIETLWSNQPDIDHQDRLNHVIKRLRQALSTEDSAGEVVATDAGIGYRLAVPVVAVESLAAAKRARLRLWAWAAVAAVAGVGVFTALSAQQSAGPPTPGSVSVNLLHGAGSVPPEWLLAWRSGLIASLAAGGSLRVVDGVVDSAFRVEGGAVTRNPPHMAVLRLVDTSTGVVLWSQVFRQRDDLDAMAQLAITETTREVHRRLLPKESQRVALVQSHSRPRTEQYGRGLAALDAGDTDSALEILRRVVAEEPGFALAHAALARTLIHRGWFNSDARPDFVPAARMAALDALAIDDSLAEPYVVLANIKGFHDWDWQSAEALYRNALQRNPGHAPVYVDYAAFLVVHGRVEAARQAMRTADFLAPDEPGVQGMIGNLMYYVEDFRQAHVHLDNALAIEPDNVFFLGVKVCTYLYDGRLREADSLLTKAQSANGADPMLRIVRSMLLLEQNRPQEGRHVLAEVDLDHLSSMGNMMSIAAQYALGEKTIAFQRLREAQDRRLIAMAFTSVHPAYEAVRKDPRYASLKTGMNLNEFVAVRFGGSDMQAGW